MNKETVEDICAFVGIINHSSENGEGGGVVLSAFELPWIFHDLFVGRDWSLWKIVRRLGFLSSMNEFWIYIYYWCGCLTYVKRRLVSPFWKKISNIDQEIRKFNKQVDSPTGENKCRLVSQVGKENNRTMAKVVQQPC